MVRYEKIKNCRSQMFTIIGIYGFLLIIIVFSLLPVVSAARFQDNSGDSPSSGMPDYAKSIIVEDHYLRIQQDSEHSIIVEELIWFKNEGIENHDGKIFTWSQPSEILNSISQFGVVINETYEPVKVYPLGNFLFTNLSENNFTIKTEESLQFVFKYLLSYSSTDKFSFSKTFLYNNSNIIIIIEPKTNFKVEGKGELELIYEPNSNTYATQHAQILSKELGESVSISFTKKTQEQSSNGEKSNSTSDFSNNWIYLLIFIVICAIVTIFIRYQRQKSISEAKSDYKSTKKSGKPISGRDIRDIKSTKSRGSQSRETRTRDKKERTDKKMKATKTGEKPPMDERKALNQEKKKILKTTNRLKNDYKEGLISKETYDKLRNNYKQKLKKVNKKIERIDKHQVTGMAGEAVRTDENPEIQRLTAKKEKILRAINKLENDKNDGVIDDDLYDEMSAAYKKQAIGILEKIDQLRENNL